MQTDPNKDTELHDKINRETARIAWSELVRHFAQGNVIFVSPALDLIDVAVRMSHDDEASIADWMAAGLVGKATDLQAQTWTAAQAALWTAVVHPFVLVQPEKTPVH